MNLKETRTDNLTKQIKSNENTGLEIKIMGSKKFVGLFKMLPKNSDRLFGQPNRKEKETKSLRI